MVSIIIVNYKVEKELAACIASIISSKPKVLFEIIVVDNDQKSNLNESFKKIPQVKYVRSKSNVGFGAGNNLGARYAKGDFLFFLSPDTIVEKGSIDILFKFIIGNSKAGMVAPLLFDPNGKVYPYQGSDAFTFISAIVILSFLNKIFPNNPISKKFFHKDWNKKNTEEFDVVPGTAFMIRKNVFKKTGMFDKNFFLYFEEYDLAKRIKKLGFKNYIVSGAKILHIWEASTKKRTDINKIFAQSRYHFFKKHYGKLLALIINLVSNFGKYELMLGLIVVLSSFLGFFKIKELMVFIGDQGWFYLSARDMLTEGRIPLVGIASSHPWLHQGPLWTYLLAFSLWIFNFNPVSGAYLTILIGMLTVIAMYLVGYSFFSKSVGIISALLYATSPLAVFYMRFPYHTSIIPIFVIAFIYFLSKVVQNKLAYLPLTLFSLGVLYNFEVATAILWVFLPGILGYKLLRKKLDFKEIFNKKILTLSAAALILPMLPMLLYDVRNGFPQTIKFTAWIFYKVVSVLANQQHEISIDKIITMFNFLSDNFRKLIFAQSDLISQIFLFCTTVWMGYFIFQKKAKNDLHNFLFILFFIPSSLVILNQTPSDAYLTILFPTTILIFALFLNFLMRIERMKIAIFVLTIIVVFGNIRFIFKNDFTFDKSSRMFALDKRLEAAHKILNIAGRKDYNLKGRGSASEYESFIANYEYLTWWLGHAPSDDYQNLKIYVSESSNRIKIENNNK